MLKFYENLRDVLLGMLVSSFISGVGFAQDAVVPSEIPQVDPNAVAPVADPNAVAPVADPSAVAPVADPNAVVPVVDPNAVAPAQVVDPNSVAPAAVADPNSVPSSADMAQPKPIGPSLDSWLNEMRTRAPVFPRTIVFVKNLNESVSKDPKAPKQIKFMNVDADGLNNLSNFVVASTMSADWNLKLNKRKYASMDRLATVFASSGADIVVIAPDSGDWQGFRLEAGKSVQLFTLPAPKVATNDDLIAWLYMALGWDGIVLDQKGDQVLVGSTVKSMAIPQVQALAVGDSVAKVMLKPNERVGAGLLSLREGRGAFGVFDIVFLGQGVTTLQPGTKLVIEKKN